MWCAIIDSWYKSWPYCIFVWCSSTTIYSKLLLSRNIGAHHEDKLKECNMKDFYCTLCISILFILHLQVSCYSNPSRGRLVFNWSTNAFSCTLTTKLPLFPGHILGTDIYIKAFAVVRTNHYQQFLLSVLWQQMWCKHRLLKATILPHQGIIIILMLVGYIISLAGAFSK